MNQPEASTLVQRASGRPPFFRMEWPMHWSKKFALGCAAAVLLAVPALAQDHKVYLSWAPKPPLVPYVAPNKPVTRIADVLRRHTGRASWTEDVVETQRYSAKWIQMAP